MFLIDDVLLAPGKAAMVLFQQLARKAQEEWLNDDTIRQDLQHLYELLEAGRISERDFEEHECRLLERLEQIARIKFQDKWGPADAPEEQPIVEASVTMSSLEQLPPAAPRVLLPPVVVPEPAPIAAPAPLFTAPPNAGFENPAYATPRVVTPPGPSERPRVEGPGLSERPRVEGWVTPPAPAPQVHPGALQQPLPSSGASLSIGQVMEAAVRALGMLKMRVSTITSVLPDNGQWKVSVELVERRGIPDTNDVLGVYELWLDAAGNVLRYERTQMRRRCDFSR